ncbi:MAG TPA: PLP-dependent aminotransferase family protein [Noviherbaspirillum sp.]|jgi:DNA-binding transcriptional MocR family regulator|uniref:aminotransferase-like domain-containing protein n=1 Tax=Noviherbaspirillum sp. TaxID=1926288 RepID=UPI002F92F375
MDVQPLYRQLANHYLGAIRAGALKHGERMPSVRSIMRLHSVSLSTALQTCRELEREGWIEARPRSGYFIRPPLRNSIPRPEEPDLAIPPDPAQYVGIHARVSHFIEQGRRQPVRLGLSGARAAPELYPAEKLKNAALRALRKHPEILVTAAPASGHLHFREVIAKRAVAGGQVLAPDDVIVTHGCIEALNLALRAVTRPGDTVAVESPTFYGLLQILESLGLRALEIPTSVSTGLSVDALEMALASYPDIKAVVVVPHLQNPLGSIMPDAEKRRLVQLCERATVALIEDDTYSDLVDAVSPPTALKAWDHSGNVIHCASLHKTLAPGMRLGWMTAGRWQARVAMLKYAQTRDNEVWSQIAAAEYMASSEYDRHLRRLRQALREQRERMADAIATHFPHGTRMTIPNGGITIWVELPARLSSKDVFDAALAQGILVAPGAMFSNSNRYDHFLRLNCGLRTTPEVEQGVATLGRIVATRARKSTRAA